MQPKKMVAGNSFRTRSHNSWGTLYGRQGARAENSPLLFRKTGQIGNKPFEKPLLFRKTGQIGNKPFEKLHLFRKTSEIRNKPSKKPHLFRKNAKIGNKPGAPTTRTRGAQDISRSRPIYVRFYLNHSVRWSLA